MKRASFKIIAISLALTGSSVAESGESRTDGRINIGGVLYSEVEMKDPEKRRKTEQAIERIKQLKEIEKKPRDYHEISTPELFRIVITHTGDARFSEDLNELSKRPAETKESIDNFLKNETAFPFNGDLLFFSRLPAVAKMLGTEYHVEVTKRILDHPLAKKYDDILIYDKSSSMVGGGLLDHLATSGKDESETLDKLIAEGRIERGSELELKWRKELTKDTAQILPGRSGGERISKGINLPAVSAPELGGNGNESPETGSFRWPLAVGAFLSVIVLSLLGRSWLRKR